MSAAGGSRRGLIVAIVGGVLTLLIAIGALLWWKLPTWKPDWVIYHSPFIEPWYRALDTCWEKAGDPATALAHLHSHWPQDGIPWLIRRLEAEGPTKAWLALDLIASSMDPRGAASLVTVVGEGSEDQVLGAVMGLLNLGVTGWEGALVERMQTAIDRFRASGDTCDSVVWVLGDHLTNTVGLVPSPTVLPPLLDALALIEPAVEHEGYAYNPLRTQILSHGPQLCARLLADERPQIRRTALHALAFSAATGHHRVLPQVALSLRDGPSLAPLLIHLAETEPVAFALLAVACLDQIEAGAEGTDHLLHLALARNGDGAALEAFDRCRTRITDAHVPLLAGCLAPEQEVALRYRAAKALIALGTPAAREALTISLGDESDLIRGNAAEALGVPDPLDAVLTPAGEEP